MPRAQSVPITGPVLKWAREEAGFSHEELARKVKVSPQIIADWEEGKAYPTKTQFTKLVTALKRNRAVFFLPHPPEEPSIVARLRPPPGVHARPPTFQERLTAREAQRMQQVAAWVLEELGEPPPDIPEATLDKNPDTLASQVRERLGISIEEQRSWKDSAVAWRKWRSALEREGIFVFALSIGKDACRGLSLWSERAPVIVVNTAYVPPARIFTLFHEYGHLLLRADTMDTQVPLIQEAQSDEERWCERFSAALLMPADDFSKSLGESDWDKAQGFEERYKIVQGLARRYKVSIRAAARRIMDLGKTTWNFLQEVDKEAIPLEQQKQAGGRGQDVAARRLQEWGTLLPTLLLRAREKGILATHHLMDYLEISPHNLEILQERLSEQ